MCCLYEQIFCMTNTVLVTTPETFPRPLYYSLSKLLPHRRKPEPSENGGNKLIRGFVGKKKKKIQIPDCFRDPNKRPIYHRRGVVGSYREGFVFLGVFCVFLSASSSSGIAEAIRSVFFLREYRKDYFHLTIQNKSLLFSTGLWRSKSAKKYINKYIIK